MTSISLCMIVRDEQKLLPTCLQACDGMWDELVVVDTGSTDDTRKILQQFGAKIIDWEWTEDFSAARNLAFDHAQSNFIVYLDADETVSPELKQAILTAAQDPNCGAATFVVHSELDQNGAYVKPQIRMVRNHPSIRFRGIVHEELVTTALAYLQREKKQLQHLPGKLHHVGYTREVCLQKDKKNRDYRLLKKTLECDPNDMYAWYKILELATFWQDMAMLQENTVAALMALARVDQQQLQKNHYLGDFLVLLSRNAFSDNEAQLNFLSKYKNIVSPNARYCLRMGELLEQKQCIDEAQAYYEQCIALKDSTPNIDLASLRPKVALARICLMRGEVQNALECLRQAAYDNPRDSELLFALAFITHRLQGKEGLISIGEALEKTFGVRGEWHVALAERALRAGELPEAISQFETAIAQGLVQYTPILEKTKRLLAPKAG